MLKKIGTCGSNSKILH